MLDCLNLHRIKCKALIISSLNLLKERRHIANVLFVVNILFSGATIQSYVHLLAWSTGPWEDRAAESSTEQPVACGRRGHIVPEEAREREPDVYM